MNGNLTTLAAQAHGDDLLRAADKALVGAAVPRRPMLLMRAVRSLPALGRIWRPAPEPVPVTPPPPMTPVVKHAPAVTDA